MKNTRKVLHINPLVKRWQLHSGWHWKYNSNRALYISYTNELSTGQSPSFILKKQKQGRDICDVYNILTAWNGVVQIHRDVIHHFLEPPAANIVWWVSVNNQHVGWKTSVWNSKVSWKMESTGQSRRWVGHESFHTTHNWTTNGPALLNGDNRV